MFVDAILPNADGYMLICHFLLYISMFWIAYIVFSNTDGLRKRMILLMTAVIVLLGFGKRDLSNANFTIQAGGLATVGAISIFAGMRSKNIIPYLFMAILFLTFGAMIRMEACLLILPYIGLHICADVICLKDKKKVKKVCILLLIPFFSVGLIYHINMSVNSSEKYKAGYEFNHVRATLVDYPKKEWEEVKDYLPEITENEYIGIGHHLYGDTERNNTEYFRKIASVSMEQKVFQPLLNCGRIIVICLQMNYFLLILITVLSIFAIMKDIGKWRKIEIICAIIGTILIFMFLCFNGRILLRVFIPAILGYLSIICTILLYEVKEITESKNIAYSRCIPVFSSIVAMIFFVNAWNEDIKFAPSLHAKTGADESKFESYYAKDNLYVWDTRTLDKDGYEYFAKQGKLPTEDFLLHNVPQGEWTYGQPYMQEYFEKINTKNPVRALIERENTYYVAENKQLMETYLKEHVNSDILVEKVDEIDGIPVWKFYIQK